MKIILLKDVKGVGKRFEQKEVASGYAENFLIPKQLARYATEQAVKELANLQEQKSKSEALVLEKLEEKLKEFDVLKIKAKANEQGNLFAKIGKKEIAEATGIPEELILLEKPIKEASTHSISIKVGEKEKKINLEVTNS